MRLSLKATAIAAGLLWGGAILLVGLLNLADPRYGLNFIQMTSSVYPWFHPTRSVANVIIGTIDGLIDGAFAGLLFVLLYNAIDKGRCTSAIRIRTSKPKFSNPSPTIPDESRLRVRGSTRSLKLVIPKIAG